MSEYSLLLSHKNVRRCGKKKNVIDHNPVHIFMHYSLNYTRQFRLCKMLPGQINYRLRKSPALRAFVFLTRPRLAISHRLRASRTVILESQAAIIQGGSNMTGTDLFTHK
jgi:hypothetical protein